MSENVDTIAAVATAQGPGALAVVRLSGPEAHEILRRLTKGETSTLGARVATLLEIRDPDDGRPLDRALVTRYDAPASFTGEDMVELSCHGGWLVPSLVLQACLDAGARKAEAGEFTRRAYLHGKMDLVQAEAVADLVGARSRALHGAALTQLDRGLSERVSEMRRELVRLEALLAHHLDFPEEDEAPVPIGTVASEAGDLVARLNALLVTAPEGELLREGAVTVLAGLPNSGKSSLYNALIGEDRAIVTPEPGTTRDALETVVQVGGYPFRLVDTAGLRVTEDRVEQLGVEVARRQLAKANVVVLCIEGGSTGLGGLGEAERSFLGEIPDVPVVVVHTKEDLRGTDEGSPEERDGSAAWASTIGPGRAAGEVCVSSMTGVGLERLRELLVDAVFRGLVRIASDLPVITRRRHAKSLQVARDEVEAFGVALADEVPAEMAAAHLRSAESALEELIGVVSVEDVLDEVFREFCVGK